MDQQTQSKLLHTVNKNNHNFSFSLKTFDGFPSGTHEGLCATIGSVGLDKLEHWWGNPMNHGDEEGKSKLKRDENPIVDVMILPPKSRL